LREIKFVEAIREALREEMERDPRVFLLGEDVGQHFGGAFRVSLGLGDTFGAERVRDTPISEYAIAGFAVGAAMTGTRPIAEIMFSDLLTLAADQICNLAAKLRYMSGGQTSIPLVVRTPLGGGLSFAAQHSQCPEAWFMHIPGLKVVLPSTPYDAKGLLKTAIRDDNPIMFFEHKALYSIKGEVPEEEYVIPLGEAEIKRDGNDVTIVATAQMVQQSLQAAEELNKEGIDVEIIDPRTLIPLDKKTILESVKKTHRVIVVSEDCMTAGFSAEVSAMISENALDYLDAPIIRLAEPDTPIPFSPPLERYVIPNKEKIITSVKELVT
jgi:pyruvate/2-oxoglutarate/acetoin dehydrogenase E1 component